MNAVLFTCYNRTPEQLELSKRALASILAQDIPVHVFAVDNGSTPETWEWLSSLELPNLTCEYRPENTPPTKLVNFWFGQLYSRMGVDHILGVPNDVRLPSNAYSQLLRWPRGFVSATDNGHSEPIVRTATAVSECTPMAVMLTRKWAYNAIIAKDGYFFDENMFLYASDCDLALRMAACGIRGVQLDVPFYHYGSGSWRLSTPDVAQAITRQADRDREYFLRKWGFPVDDIRYGQSAGDINFLG